MRCELFLSSTVKLLNMAFLGWNTNMILVIFTLSMMRRIIFFFTGTYCHWRNDNIYSNFSATLICCCHLISQCQLTTSGQRRHFLPTLPNRSVQDIKYACIYIQEEGEKWYKHFLHCRNTRISFQLSWDWLSDKVLLRKCLQSWSLGTLNIDFLLMRPQI